MSTKPFLKWAGGKRWLIARDDFRLPPFKRYFEPFLGGGAVFFHTAPSNALLSDVNERLIEAYQMVRDYPLAISNVLHEHHRRHCKSYYYEVRGASYTQPLLRAGQFIYLNRACWNGLYRVNLKGQFNVPIGTKNWIVNAEDDFWTLSRALRRAQLQACDFSETIGKAEQGDLVFIDPPYTVAHNMNGFRKYNETIFSWEDQVRLRDCISEAVERGASVVMTNADHSSVAQLYEGLTVPAKMERYSVIAGTSEHRRQTKEALFVFTR